MVIDHIRCVVNFDLYELDQSRDYGPNKASIVLFIIKIGLQES